MLTIILYYLSLLVLVLAGGAVALMVIYLAVTTHPHAAPWFDPYDPDNL